MMTSMDAHRRVPRMSYESVWDPYCAGDPLGHLPQDPRRFSKQLVTSYLSRENHIKPAISDEFDSIRVIMRLMLKYIQYTSPQFW